MKKELSCENFIEIPNMGKIKFESLKDQNKNEKNISIRNSKFIKTIQYKELGRYINNDYILKLLKKRNKIRIYESEAINLISKYRYDVFIKYYYVKEYIENNNYNLAKEIYLNHINAFNNFKEPDGKKECESGFIESFNQLIENIKSNRIYKTIIPVTKNGEIIDGAHRLAIALYLKLNVNFAIFDLLDTNYDKNFFLKRGFKKEYARIIDKEIGEKEEFKEIKNRL